MRTKYAGTMFAKVRFASQDDPWYEGLQYINGTWTWCVDGSIYEIVQSGWFKKKWAVYKFVGADTAAIGGGQLDYDRVSPYLETEYKAIGYMIGLDNETGI